MRTIRGIGEDDMYEHAVWEEVREYGHKVLMCLLGAIAVGLVVPYIAVWMLY